MFCPRILWLFKIGTIGSFFLFATGISSQFDFGGGGDDALLECSGSGSFQQQIDQGNAVVVGKIPSGLIDLEISMKSNQDVDIQLTSGAKNVINWEDGVLSSDIEETKVWNGDTITYSGYNGDEINLGNEYVFFRDDTQNAYTMYAFGYQSGYANVTYSWTGRKGCTPSGVPDGSGSGSFSQSILLDDVVTVGDLPAGLTDIYVRLESAVDIDIQLYDEEVDMAIIKWQTGLMKGSNFERLQYEDGVYIEYSGYKGEQRPNSFGNEYVYISGTLPRTLTLKVLGYAAGQAQVTYSWGYYNGVTTSSADGGGGIQNNLKTNLHNIIDGHTELSYNQCWEALQRTDQDESNPDRVTALYSRLSIPKTNRDKGNKGDDVWNREHVWAKSHGDFGTSMGAGTDIHALRVADKTVNSERSSKDFNVGGTPLNKDEPQKDCPTCKETNNTFEPPDVVKGAVARMIFYMAVRYNGDSNSNGLTLNVVDTVGTPYGSDTKDNGAIGKLSTLKAWNAQFPPSDEEYNRNNLIYDIQGNRNPFIDHPEWVDEIFS